MAKNNDWLKLLQSANISKGDKIPKGFLPLAHWLSTFEISRATWERNAPELEKAGKFTREYFKVVGIDGRAIKRPFWKVE